MINLIVAKGRKGFAIPGDLRDEVFCKHLVAEAVKELNGLDIVISNARQQSFESSMDRPGQPAELASISFNLPQATQATLLDRFMEGRVALANRENGPLFLQAQTCRS